MLININKNRFVITGNTTNDTDIYSTKIIDKLPDDIDEYSYRYINGKLIKDKPYSNFEPSAKQLEENDEALSEELLDAETNYEELEEAIAELSDIINSNEESEEE